MRPPRRSSASCWAGQSTGWEAVGQSGRVAEARKTLAVSGLASDRRVIKERDKGGWIYRVLRRGAETMILPD
jgi:hypothetical protein